MPFKFSIVADVKGYLQGMKSVEDALEDNADALDDLARDAQRAGREIGDGLEEGAETGTKSVDDLERSFRDMAKSAQKQSKKAGDDIGDNVTKGTRRAEDGMDELGSEAAGTAREAAASFDGSAESIGDAFQETAANALAGFGPLGAAAGIALAAGFGTLTTLLQGKSEETKARISELTDALIESQRAVAAEEFIQEGLRAIFTESEDAAVGLSRLAELARETGVEQRLWARAFAGDRDALDATLESVNIRLERNAESLRTADDASRSYYAAELLNLQEAKGALEGLSTNYDAAATRAKGYNDALAASSEAAAGSAVRAGDEYDNLGRRLSALPDTKTITVTADTTDAERKIKKITDTVYQVTIQGRPVGMRYE